MYLVWIKDHELPIGAETEKSIEEIKEAFGAENIIEIETR